MSVIMWPSGNKQHSSNTLVVGVFKPRTLIKNVSACWKDKYGNLFLINREKILSDHPLIKDSDEHILKVTRRNLERADFRQLILGLMFIEAFEGDSKKRIAVLVAQALEDTILSSKRRTIMSIKDNVDSIGLTLTKTQEKKLNNLLAETHKQGSTKYD